MLRSLALYLAAILQDGDYANDWLTHLPRAMRPLVQRAGHVLATSLEQTPSLLAAVARMVGDLISCGDPALPARWTPAMIPAWHALTRLYDLLLSIGAC